MTITAKEISKKMGLSEAAVSMALNNKKGVSTKTRKKVIETAKELGYDFSKINDEQPENLYKDIIQFIIFKKNGAIVTETPFFSELTEGITTACYANNFLINISYLYEHEDLNIQLEKLITFDCKGIILLGTELSENAHKPFKNLKTPLVIVDSCLENVNSNYVLIDNINGAFTATDYLIKRCNSQPGYLKSNVQIPNFTERSDGFYKAVRKNGMPVSKSIVHNLSPSIEGAYYDMKDLLLQGEIPCKSYFADNDFIAFGAIKAFKEFGYTIPDDISVIGFDNMPHCAHFEPPLTTISVPKFHMGELAAKRLIELINNKASCPIKILVCTSMIKRNSVI